MNPNAKGLSPAEKLAGVADVRDPSKDEAMLEGALPLSVTASESHAESLRLAESGAGRSPARDGKK